MPRRTTATGLSVVMLAAAALAAAASALTEMVHRVAGSRSGAERTLGCEDTSDPAVRARWQNGLGRREACAGDRASGAGR
ncbi:hypothetical protein Sgleb_05290 [Streptomyces glebosus]|uniref:Flp pilus-assembly TadG-like N-terminal domain-containing protein n=1 Tax=Streptomyces glebosus TaxID=249580 RepID=A0A640SNW4_9ACTN|nr:hypothetical protein Sgleb_05290 [Streptomyces glebosus]GHG70843.1 hypothetical protein GCM10010513_42490 [Streptomyces glebosus]